MKDALPETLPYNVYVSVYLCSDWHFKILIKAFYLLA